MEKARDGNRREDVYLKEKAQAEVLREDLGGTLEKDAGRLLKRASLPTSISNGNDGERKNASRSITGKEGIQNACEKDAPRNGKKAARTHKGMEARKKAAEVRKGVEAGKGVVAVRKGMEAGKRTAEALLRKPEEAGTGIAGAADDENARTLKDSVHIYQRGVEEAVHGARSVAGLTSKGNGLEKMRDAPISPQALRRKIREEAASRERQPAAETRTAKVRGGDKAGAAGRKEAMHKNKKAPEKEGMPDGSRKWGGKSPYAGGVKEGKEKEGWKGNVLGMRREGEFRKDVEATLSRQQSRLHAQDNEGGAEELRMSLSRPDHPVVKSPAEEAKEALTESKPSSGKKLAIKKAKKKKMRENFLEGRTGDRRGAASLKKMGRGMAAVSAKSAGTGAKAGAMASNPGGWILLVAAGAAIAILTAFLFIVLVSSMVSGGDVQTSSSAAAAAKTFSAKVESYRGDVAVEARKYGMEGYINLFLSVMEVESHGNGNDVFQCSESLGLPRNSLPIEKSIAQGVKYLASCIREARVKSPSDLDGIRLAVQGYNFGNGYIPWAVKRDGGWTQENALEFAKIHSKGIRRKGEAYIRRAGPWNYGDQYYADHVLEYYGAEASSAPAGECAKVPAGDRMKWLFPDGVPKTPSQMKRYLVQIEAPILNREGKGAAMKLTVHKKLAGEIKAVFEDLKKAGIRTVPSCTAAYNWRKMATNSSKQSHHSYGSVVDWNWTYNPICYPGTTGYRSQPKSQFMADQKVVGIWKAHGFYWGGDWKSYHDYMHFTYTNN